MQKDEILDLLKGEAPVYVSYGGVRAEVVEYRANNQFGIRFMLGQNLMAISTNVESLIPWVEQLRELNDSDYLKLLGGDSIEVTHKKTRKKHTAVGVRTQHPEQIPSIILKGNQLTWERGICFGIPVHPSVGQPKFKVGDRVKIRPDSMWQVPFCDVNPICEIRTVGWNSDMEIEYTCEFSSTKEDHIKTGTIKETLLEVTSE